MTDEQNIPKTDATTQTQRLTTNEPSSTPNYIYDTETHEWTNVLTGEKSNVLPLATAVVRESDYNAYVEFQNSLSHIDPMQEYLTQQQDPYGWARIPQQPVFVGESDSHGNEKHEQETFETNQTQSDEGHHG